jgi:hypothetical protein
MSYWREKNERALEALRPLPWARKLVSNIDKRGMSWEMDDFLFELRFAYDATRAGLQPLYEHPAGVGGSTVDFMLPGDVPWLVELVSIRESTHAKAATITRKLGTGVSVSSMFLGGDFPRDPARAKQTPQHELLRVVYKIGEKVFDGEGAIKFPVPDGSAFHMILVDMRGFEGMVGHPDRDHCRQIVGGPGLVDDKDFVERHADTGEAIRGFWDPVNKSPAALLLRQRVHVV